MRRTIGAALLVLCLATAGCSGDDDDGERVGRDGTTTTLARESGAGSDATLTSGAESGQDGNRSTSTSRRAQSGGTDGGSAATSTTAKAPFQSAGAIRIQGSRFEPSILGVQERTRVTTTNHDAITHTWTSDSGEWDSGNIVPGGSFTFSFTRVGTFAYHCKIHRSMTGTVSVS